MGLAAGTVLAAVCNEQCSGVCDKNDDGDDIEENDDGDVH